MLSIINKLYALFVRCLEALQAPALLAIRLVWGALFVYEGYAKFSNISSNAEYFSSLGFSSPVFMVWLSASAQLLGGILLAVGLFSRIASIPLIVTMLVAAIMDPSSHAFWGQGTDSTEAFLSQIPLVFTYMTAIVLFFGPGKWSIDHLLKDKIPLCR